MINSNNKQNNIVSNIAGYSVALGRLGATAATRRGVAKAMAGIVGGGNDREQKMLRFYFGTVLPVLAEQGYFHFILKLRHNNGALKTADELTADVASHNAQFDWLKQFASSEGRRNLAFAIIDKQAVADAWAEADEQLASGNLEAGYKAEAEANRLNALLESNHNVPILAIHDINFAAKQEAEAEAAAIVAESTLLQALKAEAEAPAEA